MQANVDLDSGFDTVVGDLVRADQERDAERYREPADLRAQLARARGLGLPAVTVLPEGRRRRCPPGADSRPLRARR